MYLTSFIHRGELFEIAKRWFCGRPEPDDALRLTEIFICDGYVVGETLEVIAEQLFRRITPEPVRKRRIRVKGELRGALCRGNCRNTPRMEELFRLYEKRPDYFYQEAPINGVMCLGEDDQLLGLYRIKRPRRIAEKANRKIANWIFSVVQSKARTMAELRANAFGIPLQMLVTSQAQMVQEFVDAEDAISRSFSEGTIEFSREDLAIFDVGGIKVICEPEELVALENELIQDPSFRVMEQEEYQGKYKAKSLILEVAWNPELVCRKYRDTRRWEKYLNRGIPRETLARGIEPLLAGADTKICIELILTTYADLVESELGNSIHEERILAQRDNKVYMGYIPTNVEFLLEYLFAVGFSPQTQIDQVPIKLWGRYLPDTLVSEIRRLYHLPEYDLFY
jgi:hypothetical protein